MSLRRRLQSETAEVHRQLDRLAVERGWFDDRSGYGTWLRGMYAFHGIVHQALSCVAADAKPAADRVARLAADMADLGISLPARAPAGPLGVHDDAGALGVLYVTEGARLGASLLLKRAGRLGFCGARGARFLTAEAGGLVDWHAALKALDEAVLDEAGIARAVAASTRTFALAVECLDDCHA